MLKYSNPFWHLRNTGNATHARTAPGVYKRRRTNWSGTRYGGMPPRMRGYYRRSGYWRRDGRTPGGSVEMKFFDKVQGLTGDLSAGTVIANGLVAGITQGTGEQDRIGRKIILKSVYIRGHFYMDPLYQVTSPPPQMVRIMLIEDRQCNGANATQGELFEALPGATHLLNSMNNLANKNRFKTHMDKVVTLNYDTTYINNAETHYYAQAKYRTFKLYKKMNLPIEFSGTGVSTIANIQSNNLFIWIQTASSATNITFDSVSRVRFVG